MEELMKSLIIFAPAHPVERSATCLMPSLVLLKFLES